MAGLSPLKSKPLRIPGQSLDEALDKLTNDRLFEIFFFPAFFWIVAFMQFVVEWTHTKDAGVTFLAAAVCFTALAIIQYRRLRKHIVALKLGRDGERAVGQFLEGLRSAGARIFHDIPGENFNIDHVVISEQGVFAIETKTRTKPNARAEVTLREGRLLVAGHVPDRDPIEQVNAQMRWLSRLLSESTGKDIPVRGAIVFPGWFVDPALKNAFENVWVLEPKALPTFIEQEPHRMSAQDVAMTAYHLSRFVRSA